MDQIWLTVIRRLKGLSSESSPLDKEVDKVWEAASGYKEGAFVPDVNANWQRFQRKLKDEAAEVRVLPIRKTPGYLWRWGAAAAFVLLAGVALWRFAPAMGEEPLVRIDSGEINKLEHRLPDGSIVTLNTQSSLTYAVSFGKKGPRTLFLKGEGFFEVTHHPKKPFVVRTSKAEVKVLGTRFNLRAYPEEQGAEVEVEQGKVELRDPQTGKALLLQKNMKGNMRPGIGLVAEKVQEPETRIWRTGRMDCRGLSLGRLKEILEMRQIGTLQFSDPRLAACRVTGPLEVDQLQSSLELLCMAADLKLQRTKGNSFQVLGVPCEE